MQDILQCKVVFLQMEYFYHHYNVLKNHALLCLFNILKTVYYLIEKVFEKTNCLNQCCDRSNNDLVFFLFLFLFFVIFFDPQMQKNITNTSFLHTKK